MILVDSPAYHSSRVAQDPTMHGHRRAACSRCTGRGPRTADPRDCTFSASLAHVDLRVQFRTGCVEGKPSPTCASAISWAIPWAMPRSPGRNPGSRKPPRFASCAEGPCCTVAPHSCITSYSRERHIRPTSSNQTCPWATRSVCLPGRTIRVGSRGLNRIGHRFPVFDGSRPAGPGALLIEQTRPSNSNDKSSSLPQVYINYRRDL